MGFGIGFDLISSLFPFFFIVIFLVVIGMFLFVFVSGISQYRRNNASPVLTVEARVTAKRTSFHRHTDSSPGFSNYYATFEVESGDRIELSLNGREYGMLAEGDRGWLTFQGTRYLGFSREKQKTP